MREVIFEQLVLRSADGKTPLAGYIWRAEGEAPRAIIQLSHGMCEYIQRYDAWARRFVALGYLVCGIDHLGHGNSAANPEGLGFTAARGGASLLVEDAHAMTAQIRARYPDVPIILYGHSMGSFVARAYLSRYGAELTGALISGTAGPGQPTGAGLLLTHAVAGVKGDQHRSKFLTSIAFGGYNKKFKGESDAAAWLTRDTAVREAYEKDPFCHFVFTAAGYDTLFSLLGEVSSSKWAQTVPKSLPVLLFSGDMDPVGGYGKGVEKVYRRLCDAGCNVRLKLYQGGRHEMHNELNRDEVFADLAAYLEEILK